MKLHSLALSIGMFAAAAGASGDDLPIVDRSVLRRGPPRAA